MPAGNLIDRPFGIENRRPKLLSNRVPPVKPTMTGRRNSSLIQVASFDAKDGSENQTPYR
jgi:hypothetical protein